jgi:thiamine monophosphate synthase
MIVQFRYSNGRERAMNRREAEILRKLKRGTYQTADLVANVQYLTADVVHIEQKSIDDMNKAELHALAKEMGIRVHHMAGADTVRAKIREVQEE